MTFSQCQVETQTLVDHLGKIPVFSELRPLDLAEVVQSCVCYSVDDGSYLFHADDPADQIFFLLQGALEVLRFAADGRTGVVLNTLRPGDTVGELAVVRGEPRSASVRARGRTVVCALSATVFRDYLRRFPEMAIALTRVASSSLLQIERRALDARVVPLWLVVEDSQLRADFAPAVARASLRYVGSVGRPVQIFVGQPDELLLRQPRGATLRVHRRTGTLAEDVRALRNESSVVVVSGSLAELEELLPHCTALVSSRAERPPSLGSNARLLQASAYTPASSASVRLQDPDAAGRVARLLLGRSIGIALGGGGALGYAHIGVLLALQELGIPIDFVAGTSMGAVMAGFYLSMGLQRTVKVLTSLDSPWDWAKMFFDPEVLTTGMIAGKRMSSWLAEQYVERFDQLTTPLGIIVTDVDSGEEVVVRGGRLVDAVRASLAIPGVFTPHTFRPADEPRPRTCVDGGCVNNVPVDVVRSMGADRVIGVHVLGLNRQPGQEPWRASPNAGIFNKIPAVERVRWLIQSQYISMARTGERQVFTADIALIPNTRGFLISDFWKAAPLIEVGREAALKLRERLHVLAPPLRARPFAPTEAARPEPQQRAGGAS